MKKNIFRYPIKNINSSSNISNVNIRSLYQKLKNNKNIQNTNNNNNFLTLYPLSSFLSMDFKNNKKYTSYLSFPKNIKYSSNFNSYKTISTYDNLINDSKHNYILNKVKMLKKLVSSPLISSKYKSNINSYSKSKNNLVSQGLLSSLSSFPDKKNKNQRNNKIIDLKKNTFDLNSNDFSKISKNENFFSSEISDSLDTCGNCLLYDEICAGQPKNSIKNSIPLNLEENLTIPNLINENNINEKKEDEDKDINKNEIKNEYKDNSNNNNNNNGLLKENCEQYLNKNNNNNNDKFKDFDDILNEEKNKKIEYNTIYQNEKVENKQKEKKPIKAKVNRNIKDDKVYEYNNYNDFGTKVRESLNDKNNMYSTAFSGTIKNENKENMDRNEHNLNVININKNVNKYINGRYPNFNRKYINLDFNTVKSGVKKKSRNKKSKMQENANSKYNIYKSDFSGNNFFTEKPKNKFVSKINKDKYLYTDYIKKFRAHNYLKNKNTIDRNEIFTYYDENKNTIKNNHFFGNNTLYNSSVKPPNFFNTFEFK